MTSANRPVALLDALNYPILPSWNDTAFRGDTGVGTTLIYIGKARPGAATSEAVWQIRFLTYDVNGNVLTITWPENSSGNASNDYAFIWDNRTGYTFS